MKFRNFNLLIVLTAGCLLSSGTALAQACSDPLPTPTPVYDMNPSVTQGEIEAPTPPEETPASREYCREQKRFCNSANRDKKRTISREKSRKSRFIKYKAKDRRITNKYNACRRNVNRSIQQLQRRARPTAQRCGPSMTDLVNNRITIDFFQCRSNTSMIEDFIRETMNQVLDGIVDNIMQWVRTCALNSTVRQSCTVTEQGLVALFGGDTLEDLGGLGVSSSCLSAVNACMSSNDVARENNVRRAACRQMEAYQRQAENLAARVINCDYSKTLQIDRYHERLGSYYYDWIDALTEKATAAAAVPVMCAQYTRHCR